MNLSQQKIELGMMTRETGATSPHEIAGVIKSNGLTCTQLTFTSIGFSAVPDPLNADFCRGLREVFNAHGVQIPVLSGTFNAIHPDIQVRKAGIAEVGRLIERCPDFGATFISICTGTRNPNHMWTYHPDNCSPEAWKDLVQTMRALAHLAKGSGVTLAFEPEPGNVVTTIAQAVRLIEEVGEDCVKILCDPGNLFRVGELARMREMLEESVMMGGRHIALAHAKDIEKPLPGQNELHYTAPGSGILNFGLFLHLLSRIGYTGPLIMHGLTPLSITRARRHMESLLQSR